MEHIILEPEQEDLLKMMVEAYRSVPTGQRDPFILVIEDLQDLLFHDGFPGLKATIYRSDLEVLMRYDLVISLGANRDDHPTYEIHPLGFRFYEHLSRSENDPMDRLHKEVVRYLAAESFKARHPLSYQKWHRASSQLWSSDSQDEFTTIGHLCREAMQEYAEDLVNEFELADAPTDKQKTVARLRAMLQQQSGRLGSTEQPFLKALLAYWGTVSDLVQRQEHGGQKEGEPLIWEDARRVVFQTAIVMYEIDRVIHKGR